MTPAAAEPDHDRSSALLAAGLGLLGIGGAAGLAGSSSGTAPPIAVTPPPVVVDPPKPDQPKSDPSGSEHPTDPGKPDPNPPVNPDPKPPAHVPFAPTLSLQKDTGVSDHDLVSSSGAVNVSGLEAGATLAISLDGGQTWRSHSGDALPEALFGDDGAKHLLVKQIDANGNQGAVAELSFQLDRTAPDALRWAMPADKPALGAADVIALQGAEAGALVEYRLDASAPWLAVKDGQIPVALFSKDGTEHIEVRQTDLAGNVSPATTLVAAVDVTAPAALTLSLANDTGSSHVDRITSSGVVNVSGLEAGAHLAVRLDGDQDWRSLREDVLPESLFGADGAKHLQVKQIDAGGNEGAIAELSFQLDRTAPDALHWSMPADKPALGASDVIALQGVEAGALVEYRLDANAPWLAATDGQIPVSQFHKDGTEHIEVRQTDLAGNVSAVANLAAEVDVTAPAVPTLALANDTGVSGTDAITQSGAIRVTGVEPGAKLIARASDSDVWHEFPAGTTVLDFGLNDGNGQGTATVKQIDAAGNVSGEATLTYTLLNQVHLPSFTTTGNQTSDDVLLNGHDSLVPELSGYWFERGGVLDYRIDGGGWSAIADGGKLLSSAFGADGKHNLELRQTDLAGNVGTRLVEVMLDSKAPTVSLSLKNDDGVSSTDKITTDPAVVVDGLQAGDSFTFRVNGGDWHKGGDWLANTGPVIKPAIRDVDVLGHEGTNTLEVYATDAAGNVGVTSQLTFNYLKSQDHHVL